MAKKKAPQGPSQQHQQIYQRMNFLYQASHLLASMSDPMPSNSNDSADPAGLARQHQLHPLARYYNANMKKIGRRLVIRVDPHIKRRICKRCDSPLIPALTSTVRVKAQPEPTMVTRCSSCGTQRSLRLDASHTLCIDRPDRIYDPNPSAEPANPASVTTSEEPLQTDQPNATPCEAPPSEQPNQ
ncbi:RNAse P Rpr2/Rpp21/SNM1 subunit domain-containing protein [Gongronella butleri]|nr:RNAse P Rpr2/Rpp21/SNM1 subunit domain-containing protein [Gongronella butleri]